MAFDNNAIYIAFAIINGFSITSSQPIKIGMLTESLPLFDVPSRATVWTERRRMIDNNVVEDSSHRNEIRNIGFILVE